MVLISGSLFLPATIQLMAGLLMVMELCLPDERSLFAKWSLFSIILLSINLINLFNISMWLDCSEYSPAFCPLKSWPYISQAHGGWHGGWLPFEMSFYLNILWCMASFSFYEWR